MSNEWLQRVSSLDEPSWRTLRHAVRIFEAARRRSSDVSLEELLPDSDDPLRELVLVELATVDMELQWASACEKHVEDYLADWEELRSSRSALIALVEHECYVRGCLCGLPSPGELRRRFPRIWRAIDLGEIEARVDAEQASLDADCQVGATSSSLEESASSWASQSPLTIDQLFGRFEIQAVLGRGGMGWVYLALDRNPHLPREVALKIPRLDPEHTEASIERFLQEAQTAATIDHPNICPVYDAGEIDGVAYMAMARIRGRSMEKELKARGRLSPREAAERVARIARALAAAHRAGIVHRDIKPSNVMIDEHGEPRLMDFGLARLLPEGKRFLEAVHEGLHSTAPPSEATSHLRPLRPAFRPDPLTRSGQLAGTLPYMSPEQLQSGDVDVRSDVFSLGVVLYRALSGRLPFDGPVDEIIEGIRKRKPGHLRNRGLDVDSRLEAICLRAMAKLPGERYQSAADMAHALEAYSREAPRPRGSALRKRMHQILLAVGGSALLLAASIVSSIKTDKGAAVAELDDPSATLETKDKKPATELPGEKASATWHRTKPCPRKWSGWWCGHITHWKQWVYVIGSAHYGGVTHQTGPSSDLLTYPQMFRGF